MQPIHLAFLWHQHQPFYKNLVTGKYLLPWVRLHAIKDYLGMLLVLQEFPDIRCTINVVPSLWVQIEEYAAGEADDDGLRLTRKPAADLDDADQRYLLENLFLCNPARLINPFPRFSELYQLRNAAAKDTAQAAALHRPDALRDLQVWGTLAWFHPLAVESDPVLSALRRKGRDFTEDDKAAMLRSQHDLIRRVIPLHKKLAEAGQIEISTSPFYHPILPLLCDMESAREAMPHVPMPERRSDMRRDAEIHVQRAVAHHTKLFGRPPRGMWPAEGSVSEEIIPLLQKHGIRWLATDEGILAHSTAARLERDHDGDLITLDDLGQAYRAPGDDHAPAILFRDRVLSDAIGFQYHHGDPAAGAEHFVARLHKLAARRTPGPRVIPVFLDGENPWDHYDNAGLTFLRELYTRLSRDRIIRTTTISDYLADHPPKQQLQRLFAGSWINSDFHVWIGDQEDRRAWSLLADARETVLRKFGPPGDDNSTHARLAWEEILIAEGSDWFWWFGADRTSDQDYMFDALFRAHLTNAYTHLGQPAPPALEQPVSGPRRAAPWTNPSHTPNITLDGNVSPENEWLAAGQYAVAREAAAMLSSDETTIRQLFFGFDREHFLLRLDGSLWNSPDRHDISVILQFQTPWPMRVISEELGGPAPVARIINERGEEFQRLHSLAAKSVFELACPLIPLAAKPGIRVDFHVEIHRGDLLLQRIPQTGVISATVP